MYSVGGIERTLIISCTLNPTVSTMTTWTMQRGLKRTAIEEWTLIPTDAIFTRVCVRWALEVRLLLVERGGGLASAGGTEVGEGGGGAAGGEGAVGGVFLG